MRGAAAGVSTMKMTRVEPDHDLWPYLRSNLAFSCRVSKSKFQIQLSWMTKRQIPWVEELGRLTATGEKRACG